MWWHTWIFNICEDSLLASPLIIDLVLVAEVTARIQWKVHSSDGSVTHDYKGFPSPLNILSYTLRAP
jgi:myo-inositol-1-phosphate synthase